MFKIGDIVKCVDYKDWWHQEGILLTRGNRYKVEGVSGTNISGPKGITNTKSITDLYILHDNGEYGYFPIWFFTIDIRYQRKLKMNKLCLR